MLREEYLTSNANTAWPFQEDYPELDRDAVRMFADGGAFLATSETGCSVVVSEVTVAEESDSVGVSFVVEKRRDGEIRDSVTVHTALGEGEYTVVRQTWCFFVLDNFEVRKYLESHCESSDTGAGVSGELPLDAAAVDLTADRITSLTIYNHGDSTDSTDNAVNVIGDIMLKAGNNIALSSGQSPGADASASLFFVLAGTQGIPGNGIMITASPGLGQGRVPCVSAPDCGSGAGNIRPDDGANVLIQGDDCFQMSAEARAHGRELDTIVITGRCTACCQCEDYKKTGDRLAAQANRVVKSYRSLLNTGKEYNILANDYNDHSDSE